MRFEPMHVTRAVQRAYGIEHPIGDPFGGAAFGELNGGGSFGKYLGSAISIIGGAAMMIGSGGTLAPLLIGGAMMAGGAMSAIGTASGNSTLAKIGTITSAVAGVAGLGYTAYNNWDSISSFFSSGTEVAGTTGAVAETGATSIPGVGWNTAAAEGATIPGVGEAANFLQQSTPATFDAAAISGAMPAVDLSAASTNLTAAQGGNALAAIPNTTSGANAINATGFGSVGLPTANATALPGSGAAFGSTGGSAIGDVGGFVTGTQNAASPGLLSGVSQFIKDNPTVSLMGLQTVAGMAEGASPKSQAEGEYLQALADAKEAETAYLNAAKTQETAANTAYLLEKAKEFEKTKAYEEEKRAAYNASIAALQTPQTQNLAQTMYGGAQTGLINQAKA